MELREINEKFSHHYENYTFCVFVKLHYEKFASEMTHAFACPVVFGELVAALALALVANWPVLTHLAAWTRGVWVVLVALVST